MTELYLSIIIPTWNNLEYLKLCLSGIERNSSVPHEVIIHINEGTDGSMQWLEKRHYKLSRSPKNIGICRAVNAAASLAEGKYILYMNDDMYPCPGWDVALIDEAEQLRTELFFLSSTMIEHTPSGNPCVIISDFGRDPASFRQEELHRAYDSIPFEDWQGATWPPNMMHRTLWDKTGGLSVAFSPGMYSDPDLSMKLWQAGVRIFKGVASSRVYHFMAKSTHRIKKNDGRKQFIRKWGITPSSFTKKALCMGKPYMGELAGGVIKPGIKDRLNRFFV